MTSTATWQAAGHFAASATRSDCFAGLSIQPRDTAVMSLLSSYPRQPQVPPDLLPLASASG